MMKRSIINLILLSQVVSIGAMDRPRQGSFGQDRPSDLSCPTSSDLQSLRKDFAQMNSIYELFGYNPMLGTLPNELQVKIVQKIIAKHTQAFRPLQVEASKILVGAGYDPVFSPDGSTVVTQSGHDLKIWDAATGKLLQRLVGAGYSFVLSPDGSKLATRSGGDQKIWDVATGELLQALVGVGYSPVVSSDGSKVVTRSGDDLKIWDVATGKLQTLTRAGDFKAISPDGSKVVTGSYPDVKIWDVATGKLQMLARAGYFKAISPDGSKVVTRSYPDLKIWDVATGNQLQNLTDHTSIIYSVAFSPDGSKLATSSRDSTAKIWDVVTGKLFQNLIGHTGLVKSVAFSPDGSKLATASWDKTAKIWEVDGPDWRGYFKGYLTLDRALFLVLLYTMKKADVPTSLRLIAQRVPFMHGDPVATEQELNRLLRSFGPGGGGFSPDVMKAIIKTYDIQQPAAVATASAQACSAEGEK